MPPFSMVVVVSVTLALPIILTRRFIPHSTYLTTTVQKRLAQSLPPFHPPASCQGTPSRLRRMSLLRPCPLSAMVQLPTPSTPINDVSPLHLRLSGGTLTSSRYLIITE